MAAPVSPAPTRPPRVLIADDNPPRIQEVEARDPRIAQGLRRLAEGFQYQKLLDLFSTGSP